MAKWLMMLTMMMGCATYFGDDASAPDAAVIAPPVDAGANTCEWHKCEAPPPVPSLNNVVHNSDGTVTLSAEDFAAVQSYRDLSASWASCRRFYDELAVCE